MTQTTSLFLPLLGPEEEAPPRPAFKRSDPKMGNARSVPPTSPPRTRRRRLRRAVKVLAYTGVVLLLALAGLAGFAYWKATSIVALFQAGAKGQDVRLARPELGVSPKLSLPQILAANNFVSTTPTAVLKQTQTILILGSDRRWGESGGRSDTIMLVRVNPAVHTVSILSVPRDLRVPIPGHGYDKVNAAFADGGDRLLIATLRNYFGVKIDHFFEINFRGFSDMVNAAGGVYLPVDGRYYNRNVGTAATDFANINLLPGYQKLNGTQALQFVRFRHFDSDFYRAARQQIFLREVERQILAEKLDYGRMSSLVHAFAYNTASDITSVGEIWKLLDTIRLTPPDRMVREVVPANSLILNSIDYLQIDRSQKDAVLARWYDPRSRIRSQNLANNVLSGERAAPKTIAAASARQANAVPVDSSLQPDGGRGRALLQSLRFPAPFCYPTKIPYGYSWGSDVPARRYMLAGHPAIAAWMTAGSGRSILLMETTWGSPPILASPTRTFRRGGRSYEVWYDSGSVRQIAWRMGDTWAWFTNTLRNEIPSHQMLALAASCQAVY